MASSKNDEYIKAFGKHLKKLRESKSLKETLAWKCDIARSQIMRFEKGERSPTLSSIYAIAKGLGVEPKKLLDFDF